MAGTPRTQADLFSRMPIGVEGGTIVQDLHDMLESVYPAIFPARNFGVLADGITDDTAAIAAGLAAAADGILLMPKGTSLYTQITIPSGTSLWGLGAGVSTLKLADGADPVGGAIVNSDTTNGNERIGLRGLTLDFNGANQAVDCHGIRFERVIGFTYEHCEQINAYHHGLVSIAPAAGYNDEWTIYNVKSSGHGVGAGIEGDDFRVNDGFTGPIGATLMACRGGDASHHAFHLGPHVEAIGCRAWGAGAANFYLAGELSAALRCFGWDPGTNNVLIDGVAAEVIGGGYVGSGTATADVIRVTGTGTGARIATRASASLRYGLRVDANDVYVDSILFSNASSGLWSSGNRLTARGASYSNGRDGAEFSGSPDRVSVAMKMYGNTNSGIRAPATMTNVDFDLVDINQATPIFFPGAVPSGTIRRGAQAANPDTSGATLAALETEVNELKAALRSTGIIAP